MATMPPPKGSLPVLQYCTPEQLLVDASYQRSLDVRSHRLVQAIAKGWDWGLCQPLVVARRGDDRLFVVDGQHRLEAAKQRGDIAQLPCVIIHPGAQSDEAAAFVKLNQQRRPLTHYALWRAAVASGDELASALANVLRETGFSLSGGADASVLKPGQLNNVHALQTYHRRNGDKALRLALTCLAQAFPDQTLSFGGSMFAGVAAVVAEHSASLDQSLFVAILGEVAQADWLAQFRNHIAEHGGNTSSAAGAVLLAAYAEAANE